METTTTIAPQVQTTSSNVATAVKPEVVTPSIIPVETAQASPPVKDLITKVAEFKKSKVAAAAPTVDGVTLDQKMIDAIADPTLKEAATNLHKSLQADYTRKTQLVAESRKAVETQMEAMKNWTPDRVKQYCLDNPTFVSAAQQMTVNQSAQAPTDEFSAMTPQEKARIDALMSKVTTLEQSNFQATVAQRDMQLQARYSDYNPTQIDATIRDLASMNPLDIREHVYKSLKHDEDVAAAFELGRKEGQGLTQTKIGAITPSGNSVLSSTDKPAREKGDTDQAYFMKLSLWNLAQFKNRK